MLFDHPIHGSTSALRLDESFGTDAVLRASQSAIRNLRAIGDLDEEWFAPDSDCAKDGSGCVTAAVALVEAELGSYLDSTSTLKVHS